MFGFIGDIVQSVNQKGAAHLAYHGQRRINEQNINLTRENRDWQAMMSNTAVQRRMADLQAAGLNPLLAGRYDATTPPGGVPTLNSALGAAVEAHAKTSQAGSARRLARAQEGHLQAQTAKTVQESRNLAIQEDILDTQAENSIKQGLKLDQEVNKAKFEAELKRLKIAEAQTFEQFWIWVRNANIEELTVAVGKAAGTGLVAAALGAIMSMGNRRRFNNHGGTGVTVPKGKPERPYARRPRKRKN
jgi:hypothetical protein